MNPSNFDELTKALASSTSRRQALRTILAASVGGLLGIGGISTAFGRHHRRRAKPAKPSPGGSPGNSNCAKFCAAVYGPNTPAANQCTSDAAHNKSGNLCSQCGGNSSRVCCNKNGNFCDGTAGAFCCQQGQTCCGMTCCTSVQTCLNNTTCCATGDVCGSGAGATCGCPTGQVCLNNECVCLNAGDTCTPGSLECCGPGLRCPSGTCCAPLSFQCASTSECCEGSCETSAVLNTTVCCLPSGASVPGGCLDFFELKCCSGNCHPDTGTCFG
jgi:hypothetical protein